MAAELSWPFTSGTQTGNQQVTHVMFQEQMQFHWTWSFYRIIKHIILDCLSLRDVFIWPLVSTSWFKPRDLPSGRYVWILFSMSTDARVMLPANVSYHKVHLRHLETLFLYARLCDNWIKGAPYSLKMYFKTRLWPSVQGARHLLFFWVLELFFRDRVCFWSLLQKRLFQDTTSVGWTLC